MNNMGRLLFFCCMIGFTCAQKNVDIDSLIAELFGNNTQNNSAQTVQTLLAQKKEPTTTPQSNTQSNQAIDSIIAQVFQNNTNVGQNNQNAQNDQNAQKQQSTRRPTTISSTSTTQSGGTVTNGKCITESGEVGRCIPHNQCAITNPAQDGEGTIDLAFQYDPCQHNLEVCCSLTNTRSQEQLSTEVLRQSERPGCGWSNPNGVGSPVQGVSSDETKFGEFPWIVAVLKIEPTNPNDPASQRAPKYVGSGSLIHPRVVLTAAHYVANRSDLLVRAGEWDTQTTSELYPYQDRNVTEIKVHIDYNPGTLYYDIAVLFLESPVDLAPNVGLACLPPRNERPPVNTRCFASGWGKDQFGQEGRYAVILKKVDVPVVDRNTCQERLRQTRLGRLFELHTSFLCAGGEPGIDTCRGDGGSPLVCPIQYETDRYQQNGIVAWGVGCGEGGTPGVYVDVARMRDWIDDAVAGKGYDPKVYTA